MIENTITNNNEKENNTMNTIKYFDAVIAPDLLHDLISTYESITIIDIDSKKHLMYADLEYMHLDLSFLDNLHILQLYIDTDEVIIYIKVNDTNPLIDKQLFMSVSTAVVWDIAHLSKSLRVLETDTDKFLAYVNVEDGRIDPSFLEGLNIWEMEADKDNVIIYVKPQHD